MAETYIKDPSSGAWLVKGQAGDVPITDPVTLRGLATGQIPYNTEAISLSPRVTSPTTTQASQPQGATTPLPGPASPVSTPSGGMNPYTIFNQNMAGLLSSIQKTQTEGAATLGSNIATATNVGVSPNGAVPFDPNVSASVQSTGRENLSNAFQPVIANMNTRLTNTTNALTALSGDVKSMMAAYAPQVLQPGQSLVSPDGTVVKQGTQFAPLPAGQIDPGTGMPGFYEINSGKYASEFNTGGQTTPSVVLSQGGYPGSTIVAGIEFGSSTDGKIQPYATKPDYAQDINHIYNDLQRYVKSINGVSIPTAEVLDSYIKNNSIGKSPITGNMIMLAAGQYGIDPLVLAAVFNDESSFGTDGLAVKTLNPGNIGNTDSGSTRTFGTWKQGVDAAASELQRRIVTQQTSQNNSNTTGSTTPTGGELSSESTDKVKKLPFFYQHYVEAAPPFGAAYINSDRVSESDKPYLQRYASTAGIPFLTGNEVSNVKGIGLVYDSIAKLKSLISTTLGSGIEGRLQGLSLNQILKFGQVLSGPDLKQFDQYRTQAINNLKALTAGGTTFRINQTEIDTAVSNMPSSSDNSETAVKDLTTLTNFINDKLKSTFPDVKFPDENATENLNTSSQSILDKYGIK